jgi:hypothetical protein
MGAVKDFLNGKKMYLLAASAFFAAVAGYATGELSLTQALAAVWASLATASAKAAIVKSGPNGG